MVTRQKTKKGQLIPGQGEDPSFPDNYYLSRIMWHWILPSVSCKSRNLSLHVALRVELSEDSLPSWYIWTDAMHMNDVPLYSATGNLTAYSVFQDCTKFSWICGLGKKKEKKNKGAVLFQLIKPNQGNCQNLCRAGALTADPDRANLLGV